MTRTKASKVPITNNHTDVEQLLHMYQQMARIRTFEDKVNDLYRAAKMPGLVHLYNGEAVTPAPWRCSEKSSRSRRLGSIEFKKCGEVAEQILKCK